MRLVRIPTWMLWALVLALTAVPSLAADYPAPTEGSWVVRDFRFPASDQTAGHGTTGQARFWKRELAELLQSAPRKGK